MDNGKNCAERTKYATEIIILVCLGNVTFSKPLITVSLLSLKGNIFLQLLVVIIVNVQYQFHVYTNVHTNSKISVPVCHRDKQSRLVLIQSQYRISNGPFLVATPYYFSVKLTLMNQHQLDTLFLFCLWRVNASTCFGHYSPIFRRFCTVAIWCNYVRRILFWLRAGYGETATCT
jgi:hypothetical protein